MTPESTLYEHTNTLRKLRYLVVDDFENFRNSMRQMLRTLGAEKIELVSTGVAAIQRCTYDHFDVILCNYNLGEGKSGQHVLEELRHRKLLQHSSLFLMVTAETSREMVMGAREYHPDAYLTKPINRAMLEKRLVALAERREALLSVTRAMDQENTTEAINQCVHLLPRERKHRSWLYKTLAELYTAVGDYGQARKIYEEVLSQRALSWARLGEARVMLNQGFLEEAISGLQTLIADHPDYLEAYDALAEGLQRSGKSVQAQQLLQKAAELSPNALLRQRDLAELAGRNHDIDTATDAWRRTVQLGTWSVLDNAEHYLSLSRSLTDLSETDPGGAGKDQAEEAVRILKRAEKKFPEATDIGARSLLVRARILNAQGFRDKAGKYLDAAKAQLGEGMPNPDSGLELAKTLYRLEHKKEAETLLASLAQTYESHPEVIEKIENLLDEPVGLHQKMEARNLNREGIQAFEANDLQGAARSFEQALAIVPKHAALNLNLIQVRLKQLESGDRAILKQQAIQQCRECLAALSHLPPQHRQHRRYQALSRKLGSFQ